MKETYGNVPSDSSDDTFGSISIDSSDDRGRGSRTRKRSPKNLVPALNGTNDDLKNKKTKRSYKRRTHQKPGAENMNNSVTRTPEDSVKSSSSVRRTASSSNRRLSQPVLEVFFIFFSSVMIPKHYLLKIGYFIFPFCLNWDFFFPYFILFLVHLCFSFPFFLSPFF